MFQNLAFSRGGLETMGRKHFTEEPIALGRWAGGVVAAWGSGR